eukprot:scaffold13835_cov39-Attheya_sp.AAC.1
MDQTFQKDLSIGETLRTLMASSPLFITTSIVRVASTQSIRQSPTFLLLFLKLPQRFLHYGQT